MFQGSYDETLKLLAAVENSCTEPDKCQKDPAGRVTRMCAAHRALLDQRFLNGVLYVRREQARFQKEEWGADLQNPT